MNAPQTAGAFAPHVAPLNAESWQAWRLGERESNEFALSSPLSLDDAVTQALATNKLHPGDTLAVLYHHAGRGKRTLWLYSVKKSTKRYTWREAYDGGKPVKVHALDAKLVCETAVRSFEPVPRFDAFRDDAVGVDRSLVEARS